MVVKDRASCERGALLVGWEDSDGSTNVRNHGSSKPPGCYFMPQNNDLVLNTDFTSNTDCTGHDLLANLHFTQIALRTLKNSQKHALT